MLGVDAEVATAAQVNRYPASPAKRKLIYEVMRHSLHPWNHNSHYHPFLLSQLPSPIDRALDIGCGYGAFASRLAERATHVDAVEIDSDVLNGARQRYAKYANLRFIQGDFVTQNLPTDHYHVVTSLASLHHMDLVQALKQMKRVLRPGGILAVLGLYREATVGDYAASAAGVLANLVYRHIIYSQCPWLCPHPTLDSGDCRHQ